MLVRLVRACGSKHLAIAVQIIGEPGQARKSLWIETYVKASWCATTVGQARKSLWIETYYRSKTRLKDVGQARKSLWIETSNRVGSLWYSPGQARKSLWIETDKGWNIGCAKMVRLVRACGSKLNESSMEVLQLRSGS